MTVHAYLSALNILPALSIILAVLRYRGTYGVYIKHNKIWYSLISCTIVNNSYSRKILLKIFSTYVDYLYDESCKKHKILVLFCFYSLFINLVILKLIELSRGHLPTRTRLHENWHAKTLKIRMTKMKRFISNEAIYAISLQKVRCDRFVNPPWKIANDGTF